MAWYDEAVFYHIYPLGLTGAPRLNDHKVVHRLNTLIPWIKHMKDMHFTALYIGPLFESVGHGYETTDYKKLDCRLGDNDDLKAFVKACHDEDIKVIFDGVFNHVGREFFAFKDLLEKREASPYKDWFVNVNFSGNNEYDDHLSYENWGGYNLLVKLNQKNPEVMNYISDVMRFWVEEFDVDGIRLDAADVLDFDYMKNIRTTGDSLKEDFYLMGEVIHGDYSRWVNASTLYAVTNYTLHKGLYSGHNDHNYFEIAHTVKRNYEMGGNRPLGLRLYNFVDNHDVERIASKLNNKAHLIPVHILLYTLPGVPSIYYGSEFGIEGRKGHGEETDVPLRPALDLDDYKDALEENGLTKLISALGEIRTKVPALSYGNYEQRLLTNRQFAFARVLGDEEVIVAVNNDDNEASLNVNVGGTAYLGALSGKTYETNGSLSFTLSPNSGEIFVPVDEETHTFTAVDLEEFEEELEEETAPAEEVVLPDHVRDVPYEEMTVEELQACILAKMAKNGPVNDQMKRSVLENTYHDSLVNWVKSFR